MNIAVTGIPNPILDGETSPEKLKAAIAAERQLLILVSPSGKREFVQTGKQAKPLQDVIQSGQTRLIRSSQLDGPYYLGMFDEQGRLRILICRAPSIPPADCPYRLVIGGKEVVSEYVLSTWICHGTAGVICVCKTVWQDRVQAPAGILGML